MRLFKIIISYFCWICIAILFAYGYMFLILGPIPEPSNGFIDIIGFIIYQVALLRVGPILAGIIAALYLLVDIFYLQKKLKEHSKKRVIRFLVMFIIAIVVGFVHYMLEKVIDVI